MLRVFIKPSSQSPKGLSEGSKLHVDRHVVRINTSDDGRADASASGDRISINRTIDGSRSSNIETDGRSAVYETRTGAFGDEEAVFRNSRSRGGNRVERYADRLNES